MNEDFVKALEIELRRGDVDFQDLMNDFEFVKELNKELSLKYQDFVDSLPKPAEVDILLAKLKADSHLARVNFENVTEVELINKYKAEFTYLEKRIFQLTRFRGAAVLLEKQDAENKPMKYEDLIGK